MSTTHAATDVDRTLDHLLDAELDFRPTARPPYISHLAMSLVAARRLGASSAELEDWYLGQVADGYLIPRDRPRWLEPATEQVARDGVATVVAAALPELVHAPWAQFFHAPIRLELAIDADHPGQVANALANWRDAAEPMAHLPAGAGDASFRDVLALLGPRVRAGDAPGLGIDEVAATPWFIDAMEHLAGHDGLLGEVTAAAAAGHVDRHHFGTLHLVTGMRALQALDQFLEADDARVLGLRAAQAVAAAQVWFNGLDLPTDEELEQRRRGPHASWDQVARAALDSGDPHVAKLVYACHLESARTGDPLYLDLAERQVGSSGSST